MKFCPINIYILLRCEPPAYGGRLCTFIAEYAAMCDL